MSTNMACLSCFFLFMAFLSSTNVCLGASKEFKVGNSDGWRESVANASDFYSEWAEKNQIHVGDSLVFEYKNDSVLQVDKFGYYHCNTSRPISKFKNGKNVFNLKKPGPAYFISGAPDHCKNGQRLLIDVKDLHPKSQSPPAIITPPKPTSDEASAPSPYSGSGVLAPASLVVATLFYASVYFV